ncbi:hypothetical protein MPOCJGCO_0136 [Methylobacterium trifolii]|uniref:Uncharacterized protein n=1 Tax=Methylobacterium trifolii TaxID=1003092 RepID=A0ABQ4TVN1_9HYPH|nr:hypothetical protein MPOCJGCO_0136 [Methylobacterium trifolii]
MVLWFEIDLFPALQGCDPGLLDAASAATPRSASMCFEA